MGKWLAAGAVALVVVLILLWLQLRDDPTSPVVLESKPPAPGAAVSPPPAKAETKIARAEPEDLLDPKPARTPGIPAGKLDPMGDKFFERFDEQVPRRLTREAAKCYEGRHGSLHRNQKLSLMFKTKIANGVVTVHDVQIKENTVNDSALETCFIQQIQRASWKDDELPDWETDDQLVIRPERGMRKYWSEVENYVGPEAPKM